MVSGGGEGGGEEGTGGEGERGERASQTFGENLLFISTNVYIYMYETLKN